MRFCASALEYSVFRVRRVIRRTSSFFRRIFYFISIIPVALKSMETQADELRASLREIQSEAQSTNRDLLFTTVGRALTSWSKMEEMLVTIVAHLLRVHPEKAGVMMYSIFNFNTWLTVTHDLFGLDAEFGRYQKRFDKISERLKKVKDRRDQLAHHSVKMDSGKENPLITSSLMDARSKSKKLQPLSLEEVLEFTATVLDITDDLRAITEAILAERQASQNKSDEPPNDHRPQSGSQ